MDDWKVRQEIYHRLNTTHTDDAENFDIVISNDIVDNAIKYFLTKDIGWIWPAKSYMVAICYSKWLTNCFGGTYFDYLEDPDLLYGNDPYFVTYSTDPETYHKILNAIGGWNFDNQAGVVPEVYHYFVKEFLLDEEAP
jgi:hypothetical protein